MCCGNQLCVNMSHISFQKRRHVKAETKSDAGAEDAGVGGEDLSGAAVNVKYKF